MISVRQMTSSDPASRRIIATKSRISSMPRVCSPASSRKAAISAPTSARRHQRQRNAAAVRLEYTVARHLLEQRGTVGTCSGLPSSSSSMSSGTPSAARLVPDRDVPVDLQAEHHGEAALREIVGIAWRQVARLAARDQVQQDAADRGGRKFFQRVRGNASRAGSVADFDFVDPGCPRRKNSRRSPRHPAGRASATPPAAPPVRPSGRGRTCRRPPPRPRSFRLVPRRRPRPSRLSILRAASSANTSVRPALSSASASSSNSPSSMRHRISPPVGPRWGQAPGRSWARRAGHPRVQTPSSRNASPPRSSFRTIDPSLTVLHGARRVRPSSAGMRCAIPACCIHPHAQRGMFEHGLLFIMR